MNKFHKNWIAIGLALVLLLAACSPAPTALPTQVSSATPEPQPTQTSLPLMATETPTAFPTQTPTEAPTIAPSATLPAPTITPAPPLFPIWGIEMHKMDAGGGLTLVKKAGAYWLRRNALFWSRVEPLEGTRNWNAVANLEWELENAAKEGMQAILIIRSAPYWAQKLPGIECGPVKPEKLAAFASFVQEVVARYSQPPYNVKYFELGNEPDIDPSLVTGDSLFGCWGDQTDPYYGGGYYADMLKAVYPQVKAADPESKVLIGGLLLDCDPNNPPLLADGSGKVKDCSPARFLEGVLKNGGGDFFDILSFHAYDYYASKLGTFISRNWLSAWNTTGPVQIAKASFIRGVLATYGYANKPLMNTESGLLCVAKGGKCLTDDFSDTKAYYVAQVLASTLAEGLQANIWYSITGWRNSGLVSAGMSPNRAYKAFQFSAAALKDAAYAGEVSLFSGVRGYMFEQRDKRIWLIWSQDGEGHSIQLNTLPTSMYDVYGAPLEPGQAITVTIAPVYLEWAP